MHNHRLASFALWVAALSGCGNSYLSITSSVVSPTTSPTSSGSPTSPSPTGSGSSSVVLGSFECEPAAGVAPLATQCRWKDLRADEPVQCLFDPGDGKSPAPLGPCEGEGVHPYVFTSPGKFTATLRATAGAEQITATFEVNVSDTPNQAPVITTLGGVPASGTPPFDSTLQWSISDPDQDPLRCLIDLGDDGTMEHTLSPCTSATVQAVTVSAVGALTVRLKVEDDRGLSTSDTMSLAGSTASGDLSIAKVEWGQSVVSENPTLVGGKPALLRIHVVAAQANTSGVEVRAEGFRQGVSLGTVTLSGPSSPPTAVVEADLAQQYRGTVPGAWMSPGLEIKIDVDPANLLVESNENNNQLIVKPNVGTGWDFYLTSVPVVLQGVTATVPDWKETMLKIWPVKSLENVTRAPYTFSGTLMGGDGPAWSSLLSQIQSIRIADGSQRYYYGFVQVSYSSGIAGIGYLGSPSAAGRNDSPDTFVHELGHNLNRRHAPCGNPMGPDPDYPYSNASIGSTGYNFVTQSLVSPSSSYDLMSYCKPRWVSDYNYKKVQDFLSSKPPVATHVEANAFLLLVSGRIDPAGVVSLDPVHRIYSSALPPALETASPFVLRLHADGVAHDTPLETRVTGEEDGTLHFHALVPDLGVLSAIELLDQGRVIYRQDASVTPPTNSPFLLEEEPATQRVKLSWDARRYPSALVAHLDGTHRTTLALDLQGGDAYVHTDGLPEGGAFEVSLSDGVNSVRQEWPRALR